MKTELFFMFLVTAETIVSSLEHEPKDHTHQELAADPLPQTPYFTTGTAGGYFNYFGN